MKKKVKRHPMYWLLPLLLALPVLGGLGFVWTRYGQTALNALQVALKMAVIQ